MMLSPNSVHLFAKMLTECLGSISKKVEEICVQTLRLGLADDNVRDGQDLHQLSRPPVLIGRLAQHALGVEHQQLEARLVRGPHAHGAAVLGGRGAEYVLPLEKRMVQREGLALAGVANDRQDLQKKENRY